MKAYFTERRTIRNVYYITNGAAIIFMREGPVRRGGDLKMGGGDL